MWNRTKSLALRLLAALTLAGVVGSGLLLASEGDAEAQRRGRRTAQRASADEAPAQERGASASAEGVINLNTAGEDELTRLPGIGPSKAQAILRFRERARRFRRIEDLLRVRGIGRATFRRLRPMLRVDGPTTLGASSS